MLNYNYYIRCFRELSKTIQLLFNRLKSSYLLWLIILSFGTIAIFLFLLPEMGKLVQIATVLSFAPLYAFLNYRLVISKQMPEKVRPNLKLRILSIVGLLFLSGFTLFYLLSLAIQLSLV